MSTFRIPAADLSGPLGRLACAVSRRTYGKVLDFVPVMFHHRPVLWADVAWEGRIKKWNALDPHLKTYAVMASAGAIGCSWCLDFGYYQAHCEGLDEAKVREVPRWRDSGVFTELERDVMAYAEDMTATPPRVSDAQVASLRERLGDKALVELTMMVAVENQRSRFNAAAGLTSQGFSDVCGLPLAEPARPDGARGRH